MGSAKPITFQLHQGDQCVWGKVSRGEGGGGWAGGGYGREDEGDRLCLGPAWWWGRECCVYVGGAQGRLDRLAWIPNANWSLCPSLFSQSSWGQCADQHSQDLGCKRYLIIHELIASARILSGCWLYLSKDERADSWLLCWGNCSYTSQCSKRLGASRKALPATGETLALLNCVTSWGRCLQIWFFCFLQSPPSLGLNLGCQYQASTAQGAIYNRSPFSFLSGKQTLKQREACFPALSHQTWLPHRHALLRPPVLLNPPVFRNSK